FDVTTATYSKQLRSLPPWGERWRGGVPRIRCSWLTPLPNPPPQGGRERMTSPKPLACQFRAGAERHQFGFRDVAMHRRHAAIGRRDDVALRHEFRDVVDYLGDIFRGL